METSNILAELNDLLIGSSFELGDLSLRCEASNVVRVLGYLKLKKNFKLLVDITATDYADLDFEIAGGQRFDVVYHVRNLDDFQLVRVKVAVSESKPEILTITNLWEGANYLEREVFDMYGISFTGHPDLRRILMYPEFIGHPLRKDYPVQGKQPRVKLIAPEVENTARLMNRPELIAINPRTKNV